MIAEALVKLVESKDLSYEEAYSAMEDIMEGKATPSQIGGFLVALRMKGESIEEIAAFAEAMRKHSIRISPRVQGSLLDTAGTGGDSFKTFNVSTLAAIIAAGAGAKVAKHGGRSVTSGCGSADLLEALGYNLGAEPSRVERCIERTGIGFMYAPAFHPAMRHASSPRRELRLRTVFNLLGPLTNPAGADAQLLGLYDGELMDKIARVLVVLGVRSALLVYGLNGMDEVSISDETRCMMLSEGRLEPIKLTPRDFGLRPMPIEPSLLSLEESRELALSLLLGRLSDDDPRLCLALANASAALVAQGAIGDFKEGYKMAKDSVRSGSAYEKLKGMIRESGGDLGLLEQAEARLG